MLKVATNNGSVKLEIDDEIQVQQEDEVYKTMVSLVRGLAFSLINNDVDVILLAWLRFRLEQSDSPTKRLKELFQIIMHYDMTFEISSSNLILFKDTPIITHIELVELSAETKGYIKAMLSRPTLFFDYTDGMAIQHSTFSQFRFIGTFLNTGIWNRFTASYITLITSDEINVRYLGGTAHELLLSFVEDEIAYSYEKYIKEVYSNASISKTFNESNYQNWITKHKKYLLNLEIIYNDLLAVLHS